MGFTQYHEPPEELSEETRTLARIFISLQEECEAINWYQQRMSVEQDKEAKDVLATAQKEEFLHFAMDLEFLSRKLPKWKKVLETILFKEGDIVENKEKAEELVE